MLRKLRLRQKVVFLWRKSCMLKDTGQKPLWILLECSFEISSKIIIFRTGENTLLKYKHFVNSWERRFKMKLLRVCTPLQDLCFIVSICKKYLQPVFPELKCNIVILLHVYRDFSEKVQQPECSTGIKVTASLQIVNN